MPKLQMRIFTLLLSILSCLVLTSLSPANGSMEQPSLPLPKNHNLIQIDAGVNHTCGLKTDGTAACWGINSDGQSSSPFGTFSSISAGYFHTCGLATDGTIYCWGNNIYGRSTPPTGTFSSVSGGGYHTCAVKTDSTVACWGLNDAGQSNPPMGTFISVAAGQNHTCGVKTDNTVACWGGGSESIAPAGTFTSVSAGYQHTCGVKSDGTLMCWGYSGYGLLEPPGGIFTSLSAGDNHNCGVKDDGSVVCWGMNYSGQTNPPEGTFISVTGAQNHTCGVRTDNTVTCWGDNFYSQLDIPVPYVTLAVSNSVLNEGEDLSLFIVELSSRGFQNVIINLAFSGSAVSGIDYQTSAVSITITTDQDFDGGVLKALEDRLQETAETIVVDIDTVVNGSEADIQQVMLTIPANDAPSPTSTATNTPETPATVTATPSDTPSPDGNLIQNGDFEALDAAPWSVKNATGDKVKCKPDKAYSGSCVFVFKGSIGENSALQQTVTPTGITFSTEDTLDLSLFVNGKEGAIGKVKLKVSYTDGTAADKFSQDFPTTGSYSEITRRLALNSASVDKIKLQITHQSESSKVYVDDVSLMHHVGNGRLPLP